MTVGRGFEPGIILPWEGTWPRIAEDVFIAPTAAVIGDVEIGAGSVILFNVTVRGDVHSIRVGEKTNIQDGSVVHVSRGTHPTTIGSRVSIGHMALIHGCELQDGAFIGMQACIMDGVVVESDAMVAAGALVTPNTVVKSGELWGGSPAKLMRPLKDSERAYMIAIPQGYHEDGQTYRKAGIGSIRKD